MPRPALSPEEIQAFRSEACRIAVALFADHDTVSLRRLATEMGCSPATLYRYFEDSEELFMATREECFQRFANHLRETLPHEPDPFERVVLLCTTYTRYAHQHPNAFRLMFQLGQPNPTRFSWAETIGRVAWDVVEETIQNAVDHGVLRGPTREVAHVFWAATHGVASLSLSRRLRMGLSCAPLLEATVRALGRAYERDATSET